MISFNCSTWLHFIFKGCFHFILYNQYFLWQIVRGAHLKSYSATWYASLPESANSEGIMGFIYLSHFISHVLRNSLILSAVGSTSLRAGICYFAMIDHCVLMQCYDKGMNSEWGSVFGKGMPKYSQFKTNYNSAYHQRLVKYRTRA